MKKKYSKSNQKRALTCHTETFYANHANTYRQSQGRSQGGADGAAAPPEMIKLGL
jgi:hypothetical protein